ncbi:MAG: hypothetical protein ACI4S4_05215, partial [Candidatus Ornithospirochaeta sp.]
MKKTVIILLFLVSALSLQASPSAERAEAIGIREYMESLTPYASSPVLSIIHEAYLENEETAIVLEYSQSSLIFTSVSKEAEVVVSADIDDTALYIDGERIGKGNVRKNAPLLLPLLEAAYSALEDESNFRTSEKLSYHGDEWNTTIVFPEDGTDAEIYVSFTS